jgi:fatty-acyl-CoA synthase
MFIAEYNRPMFDMFDLSSLRTGIMAGSICPVEVMKKVMKICTAIRLLVSMGLQKLPLV